MPQGSQCFNCLHFWGSNKCDAFPEGIPNEVLTGEVVHNKPLKNQKNKIVFEERKGNFSLKVEED